MNYLTWSATVICLTGTVLNVKMNILCFYLWCLGNILWLTYDCSLGLYNRATLDVVQLALAIWALYLGTKNKTRRNKNEWRFS